MDAVTIEGIWLQSGMRVPAPVIPVRPATGGSMGIAPWWVMQKHEDIMDKMADEICETGLIYQKGQKQKFRTPLSQEEKILHEELCRLRKRLDKVKDEVIYLRGRNKGTQSEVEERNELIKELREKSEELTHEILRLRMARKWKDTSPIFGNFDWIKPATAPEAKAPMPPTPTPPAPLPSDEPDLMPIPASYFEQVGDEIDLLKLKIAERDHRLRAVIAALPWAAGSVGVYFITEKLVPRKRKVLRTVGFAVSGTLGVIAAIRGISEFISKPAE